MLRRITPTASSNVVGVALRDLSFRIFPAGTLSRSQCFLEIRALGRAGVTNYQASQAVLLVPLTLAVPPPGYSPKDGDDA